MVDFNSKILKYWTIHAADSYKIKKLSEVKSADEWVFFDTAAMIAKDKDGKTYKTYKTMKEAAVVALQYKISEKKEEWMKHVEESYKCNEEICKLLEDLDTLTKISKEFDEE